MDTTTPDQTRESHTEHVHVAPATPFVPRSNRAARRAFDRAYGEFKPRRPRVQRKRGRK
ncbi:hypothetical protein PBI_MALAGASYROSE_47 [Mycobacterium phage MalagasyRose]|uniref:Uncharacterized protein n=1 Tax=Mycobacterium phage MalagasyRose TaxID=2599870 RepID=A0A5J6TE68_9CAUD|nr:hypothetical protein QEH39_gp41 [Mycobacterium phage MalagasyRose]QFG08895.1 hypothetical protein PBI_MALAGASYROSE_47 [Mycobacterium phage MalagasyRose]